MKKIITILLLSYITFITGLSIGTAILIKMKKIKSVAVISDTDGPVSVFLAGKIKD